MEENGLYRARLVDESKSKTGALEYKNLTLIDTGRNEQIHILLSWRTENFNFEVTGNVESEIFILGFAKFCKTYVTIGMDVADVKNVLGGGESEESNKQVQGSEFFASVDARTAAKQEVTKMKDRPT